MHNLPAHSVAVLGKDVLAYISKMCEHVASVVRVGCCGVCDVLIVCLPTKLAE